MENALCIDGVDYSTFSHPTLVADEGGEVVGVLQAVVGVPYTMLTDMAVARAWQGKGIGAALLEGMELVLRVMGVRAWMTYAALDNERAQHGLESRGARMLGQGVAYVRSL